jgi:ankyrin repeat protein
MRKTRKSRTLRKKTYKAGRRQRGGSPYGGPIHTAIMIGDIQKAFDLINQGTNLNEKDNEGRTPLMLAAILGYSAVVNLLIIKGANIHKKDKYGSDVVTLTILRGNTSILKMLINAGINVNERDDLGHTYLMTAASQANYSIIDMLLNAGADANMQIENKTVLSYIRGDNISKSIKIVNLLFEHNISPTQSDKKKLKDLRKEVNELIKTLGNNEYNNTYPRLSDRVLVSLERHPNLTNANTNAYPVNITTNEWNIGPGNSKNNGVPRNLLPGIVPNLPAVVEAVAEMRPVEEVNPRKTCTGSGCSIMGGKQRI